MIQQVRLNRTIIVLISGQPIGLWSRAVSLLVESLAMKQLPDILTSTTFWASIATLGAASGAWFTYVAAELASRQRTYEGIRSLIEGLEEELDLVSQWASGDEGNQGYLQKSPAQLGQEHPDWFNPSRAIFKFSTPTLSNLTNSPYASYLTPVIKPLVMLNHSIRRLFENKTATTCSSLAIPSSRCYDLISGLLCDCDSKGCCLAECT